MKKQWKSPKIMNIDFEKTNGYLYCVFACVLHGSDKVTSCPQNRTSLFDAGGILCPSAMNDGNNDYCCLCGDTYENTIS